MSLRQRSPLPFSKTCILRIENYLSDVNMVLEPKPHQLERKRANSQPSIQTPNHLCSRQMVHPLKRLRNDLEGIHFVPKPKLVKLEKLMKPVLQTTTYTQASDILICGNCKELFSCLQLLIDHKKRGCKLRFTCKCYQNSIISDAPNRMVCAHCQIKYTNWWELVKHVQDSHGITIYQNTNDKTETSWNSIKEEGGSSALTPSTSFSCTSGDIGKETSSCSSDTQSGLPDNEWGPNSLGEQISEESLFQAEQNGIVKCPDKAVDTSDLEQLCEKS